MLHYFTKIIIKLKQIYTHFGKSKFNIIFTPTVNHTPQNTKPSTFIRILFQSHLIKNDIYIYIIHQYNVDILQ